MGAELTASTLQNEVPVPRDVTHKPFVKAYDPVTDTSSRLDSVLDAYANMYVDFAQSDEDEGGPEEQPEAQRREPWDTRGKTGLYGGGGRGADDSETGWVLDSPTPQHQQPRSRQGEEDLRYDDRREGPQSFQSREYEQRRRPEERRRSSSGTQSSYGPPTPVNPTFDSMAGYQDSSSPYRPIVAKAPAPLPQRTRPSFTSEKPLLPRGSITNAHFPPPSQPRAAVRQSEPVQSFERPPVPSRSELSRYPTAPSRRPSTPPPPARYAIAQPSMRQPTTSPRASDPARLHKKGRSTNSVQHPTISAPYSSQQQQSPPPASSPSSEPLARRKSTSGGFKFGRSKKAPLISAPILPDGFVESLGMETFALSPGCAAPVHHTAPRPKRKDADAAPAAAPRPQQRKQLAGAIPGSPRPNTHTIVISNPNTPALVRTPMDAYRDAGTSTPNGDVRDAFRRLSQNSDTSSSPPSIRAVAEADRKMYFKGLRDDRARQPTEVQANRGNNLGGMQRLSPPQGAQNLQRRPSAATTIGGHSVRTMQAQPPPPAKQQPYLPVSHSRADAFRDPWNSGGAPLPVAPTNYRDNNGYSEPDSPMDQQYSGSDYDSRDGHHHSASDYSLSPAPSPAPADFQGYSPASPVQYQSAPYGKSTHQPPSTHAHVQPLNFRRGSGATVSQDTRQSVAGSVVWTGSSPPPMPHGKDSSEGSNMFRNPFDAGRHQHNAPLRSGWQ